jgi:hypothetical protein
MYSPDVIEDTLARFQKHIIDDRKDYDKIMIIVSKYVSEHHIMIGGKNAANMICHNTIKDFTLTPEYFFDLYTDNPLEHSRVICDKLYEATNNPMIYQMTNVPHKEFTIFVNTRALFKLYRVDRYRGVSLIDLIKPVKLKSPFGNSLLPTLSPELLLIDIYRQLYDPGKYKQWQDLLKIEDGLFNQLLGQDIMQITGGAEKTITRDMIHDEILQKFAKGKVVIGHYAINAALGDTHKGRVSLLSKNNIADDVMELQHVLDNMYKGTNMRAKVINEPHEVKLPMDFRVKKNIVRVYISDNKSGDNKSGGNAVSGDTVSGGNADEISGEIDEWAIFNGGKVNGPRPNAIINFDIFNVAQFEIIPYSTFTFKGVELHRASHYVIMRFMLIDMWLLQIVSNISSETIDDYVTRLLRERIVNMKRMRKIISKMKPAELFPIDNLYGIYEDIDVAKKKYARQEAAASKKFFGKYYPIRNAGKKDQLTDKDNDQPNDKKDKVRALA